MSEISETHTDQACQFDCEGDTLYGVLSLPPKIQMPGILILVGGAQYRAGSHRQFTMLARAFAAQGIAAMRFDCRGMGDSEGAQRSFDQLDADIRCAIDHFMQAAPDLPGVVLWGLCDGASAALLYARHDHRVKGLALVNPWARTEAGLAQAYLRHYYIARLFSKELWLKVLRGKFNIAAAVGSLFKQVASAAGLRRDKSPATTAQDTRALPDRMLDGYTQFDGPVLQILSGQDLTAREFADLAVAGSAWATALGDDRSSRLDLPDANHTFSSKAWRQQVAERTVQWLRSISSV
jgi:exosortase A-associated hydrolase 1